MKTAVLAAAFALGASLAQAQTLIVNGDTTGGPTFAGVDDPDTIPILCTACPYQQLGIQIVDPASFRAEIVLVGPGFDTYLGLYQGSFDPSNPNANLVAVDDDDGGPGFLSQISAGLDGPFSSGQHVVVVYGFTNTDFGTYTLELDGVSLVLVDPATGIAQGATGLLFLVSDCRVRRLVAAPRQPGCRGWCDTASA